MVKTTIESIITTSIITAFTIAAALIWKDVIIGVIELFLPTSDELLYKLVAAILATIFVIIAIYLILKTEYKAIDIFDRFKDKK